MTPQEKAKELVDKFDGVGLQMRNEAIACALIAVDEIIKCAIWKYNSVEHTHFWKEVKQEIQKL